MVRGHGWVFWLIVLVLASLVLAVAILVSPFVLVAGVVIAALVAFRPKGVGGKIQRWSVWGRVPGLKEPRSPRSFAKRVLLYTVPVPAFLTAGMVVGAASNSITTVPSAPSVSAQSTSPPQETSPLPDSSPSREPSPSPPPSPSSAEPKMTAQQKADLSKVLTDELNHFNAQFAAGKAALGTEKYPNATAGLDAFNDPNSGASRFSAWRQSSKTEQDATFIDTTKTVEAMYTTNHRPDTVDAWRDDLPNMSGAIATWVMDAVSWQISEISDAQLSADEAKFHVAATTVQNDIIKIVAES